MIYKLRQCTVERMCRLELGQGHIHLQYYLRHNLIKKHEEQYPQDLLVEFIQDKCDILNSYNVGDSVKVDINLRGREWQSPQGEIKYFNSIQGWRIGSTAEEVTVEDHSPDREDDLPF